MSLNRSAVLFYVALLSSLLPQCRQRPPDAVATTRRTPVIDTRPAQLPTPQPGEAVMTVAAGCFWSVQEQFGSLRGVRAVVSGYAGGDLAYPAYEQVSTGQTGHAESVQIYYDPKVIPFDTLLTAFFTAHDASSRNRQGPDVGTHYRSVAFYRTPAEKVRIGAAIARENASGRYSRPIVTEVVAFRAFYPAEVHHQGYYRQHPNELYIRTVSTPKVDAFRERLAGWIKSE